MTHRPDDWLEIAVAEEGVNLFSEHPESEDLVLLVDAPEDLSVELRDAIGNHLRLCGGCADEVGRLRAAALELTQPEHQPVGPLADLGLWDRLRGFLSPSTIA